VRPLSAKHEGKRTDRVVGAGWKPAGTGCRLRIKTAAFRHGRITGQACRRGFEHRWDPWSVDQDHILPPFKCRPRMYRRHAQAPRGACVTFKRRDKHRALVRLIPSRRKAKSVRFRPLLREAKLRTGWCRRCAVNAVPMGKRFDSIRFPPSCFALRASQDWQGLLSEAGCPPKLRRRRAGANFRGWSWRVS
jgi:hypothetical protein